MRKSSVFIILLLFVFTAAIHSQEDSTTQDTAETDIRETSETITSIEIIGLKRTKPHIVNYSMEKYLGVKRSDFDENDVFLTIKNLSVLEPVSAELIENPQGLILRITVEEKWSIFPFPLVLATSDETMFGLFLYDANAFGVRDTAVVGGAYSSSGWTAIAMYMFTPDRQGIPGWQGVFMYNNQERKNVDRDDIKYRLYSVDRFYFSLGVNYTFAEIFTCSFSAGYTDITLKENINDFNPPPKGASLVAFSPRISFNKSSWDGFFVSQRGLTLGYSYNLVISGESFHEVEYRLTFEQPLVPGFRLNIRSRGIWKSTSSALFEEDPQPVHILPKNYSALNYSGLQIGLEKHIYRNRFGILSIQGSWQGVFTYNDAIGVSFDHGPSGGMVFYLSRVALPAIGLNYAYNMVSGLYQFSFTIGMPF